MHGSNTRVETVAGEIRIFLYTTMIVAFTAEWIRLDNGLQWTATTANRMNAIARSYALGFHVSRKGGSWSVAFDHAPKIRIDFPASGKLDVRRRVNK